MPFVCWNPQRGGFDDEDIHCKQKVWHSLVKIFFKKKTFKKNGRDSKSVWKSNDKGRYGYFWWKKIVEEGLKQENKDRIFLYFFVRTGQVNKTKTKPGKRQKNFRFFLAFLRFHKPPKILLFFFSSHKMSRFERFKQRVKIAFQTRTYIANLENLEPATFAFQTDSCCAKTCEQFEI